VHVGISDQETAVQVLNRVRPWLPGLLALSASSPFWMGTDSGYASYRTIVWGRWPSAGVPGFYHSAAEYHQVVQALIDTDTILDPAQIYWDIRLNSKHSTLEFRTADACTTVDEAVLQAGLCRALVRTGIDEARAGRPLPDVRPELLRAAKWRAARSGLEDNLIDVFDAEAVPATVLLERFLAYLRPALQDSGDWDEVTALIEQTQRRGTSAHRQRRVFAQSQRLKDVADLLVMETTIS
jgi:carboxylate-amine ligase